MNPTIQPTASRLPGSKPERAATRRITVNVPLLLGTVVLLVVAVPALYFWYSYRAEATAEDLKTRAIKLQAEGDHDGAVTYYQKFLLTKPDDTEALLGLVEAYKQGELSGARLQRLNQLLYRALGLVPDNVELRSTLAENLLKLEDVRQALHEATKLLEADPGSPSARKIIALSKFALSDVDPTVSRSEAIGEMLAVAEELPADVTLIGATANALRQHPDALPENDIDPAAKADELMNRLVDTDPNSVDARLARYQYRNFYRLPDGQQDIAKALELEPENIDALILSTRTAGARGEIDVAAFETTLRRVIELAPKDHRGYLRLAEVLLSQGKVDEAIDLLTSGRESADETFQIGLMLADVQLQSEGFEVAKTTIDEVKAESALLFPRLEAEAREFFTNQVNMLEARYALSQGDDAAAISKLMAIVASSDARQSPQWAAAASMLARIHTQAGRTDQANEYWEAVSAALPGDHGLATQAVQGLLRAGDPNGALERIEEAEKVGELSLPLKVQRVQAHLAIQLARSPGERNWTELTTALAAAKEASEPMRELVFAESQYLLAEGNSPAAIANLRAAEESFADDPTFWHIAAMTYQQLGEQEDVARAIEKHKAASDSIVDEAKLDALILVRQQDFAAADKLLDSLASSANEQERQELLLLRAEVLRASGDLASAFKLIQQGVEEGKPNEKLLTLGIDTAIVLGKLDAAQEWEERLAKATDNGFEARLARARRLTYAWEKLGAPERQELVELVAQLREERPRWYPVVTLSAGIAQLNGESRRALDEYQRAVELGNRQPSVLQQVVTLLYEAGRFDEVSRYMAMVTGDAADTPFFDMMAIEVAARQQGGEEALKLAENSVRLHPQDVERRLFYGSLLIGNDKATEAVAVLQQAAKDFSKDNRVWTALFSAYVRADQVELARKALERLVTSSLLPVEQRHFVAGQGYEIIGDLPQAIEQYKLAIAAQPRAIDVRVRYANLVSQQNPQLARAELERALQLDPTNPGVQRQLAVLLAISGNEGDWGRANALLSTSGASSGGDAATNDRLRAILLSQQGRTRAERIANCRLAREIIAPLLQRSVDDQNRLVMASILQREASLSGDNDLLLAARDEFRAALNQGPASAAELSSYIEFLLQAAKTIQKSQTEETGATANAETDAADANVAGQSATFLSDAELRLAELRRMQTADNGDLEALVAAFTARLQLARDDRAGAEATIAKFVEQHQNLEGLSPQQMAQRFLVFGQLYGVIEDHAQAEQWYRRVMEHSPEAYVLVVESLVAQGKRTEAAQVGLEMAKGNPSPAVAKVLARIMTVTSDEIEIDPAVEQALASAIESHDEDIELLQAEAVMRASRGDYAPAIATMRKILEIDPNHALTLNNLATLLAERPNQRAEALELIARAIEVAGRNPMLLDTQGTIHLKLGDAKAAIASLEEATAGRATDARYYLHLAAAYELGDRDDDARRMLGEARAFGLENFVLTEDDRQMLSSLEKSLAAEGPAEQ